MALSTSAGNMNASIAAIVANHTYGTNAAIPSGFSLVASAPAAQSNLIHPEVWKNNTTGDVIVAFRGTVPTDPNDRATDLAILLAKSLRLHSMQLHTSTPSISGTAISISQLQSLPGAGQLSSGQLARYMAGFIAEEPLTAVSISARELTVLLR